MREQLGQNNFRRCYGFFFGSIIPKVLDHNDVQSSLSIITNPAHICWSSRHVLKPSLTRLQRNNFTSSKTSLRRLGDVFKTSQRQTKCLLVISVSSKSKCVSNKSMFHKSISDKSRANASLRTQ